MEKKVKIEAESKYVSVNEIVPISKAERRLIEIRKQFEYYNRRYHPYEIIKDNTLKVRTTLIDA